MGEGGKKDKARREKQKQPKMSLKEKRQAKKEKIQGNGIRNNLIPVNRHRRQAACQDGCLPDPFFNPKHHHMWCKPVRPFTDTPPLISKNPPRARRSQRLTSFTRLAVFNRIKRLELGPNRNENVITKYFSFSPLICRQIKIHRNRLMIF